MQRNDYYLIEIITWNNIIISIREEYIKPCNRVLVIRIKLKYLIYYWAQKDLKKKLHKNVNVNVQWM